ncbi:hypothetical protein C8J56DRAFT_490403 [Mycena floridula]|nr:hypothetical protein C8J56DRAFT_490403 [Mycena floridula]
MAGLLEIPEDLLFFCFLLLSPKDILNVSQTCRMLHLFCSNDYLWHQIRTGLPLDVDPDVDLKSISGPELRQSYVKALRLDSLWLKPSTKTTLTRINHGECIVFQAGFIGKEWLITLSRAPRTIYLSIWYTLSDPHRVASLEVPNASKFAASLDSSRKEIIVALINRSSHTDAPFPQMVIYGMPLLDDTSHSHLRIISTISRSLMTGTLSEVHVSGPIVAAALAHFNNMIDPPTYHLILVNTRTGAQILVDPHIPEKISQMHFRIGHNLVIAFLRLNSLVVRTYEISNSFTKQISSLDSDIKVIEPISEFSTPNVPARFQDYTLSGDLLGPNLEHIVSLSFHPQGLSSHPGLAHVFAFPLSENVSQWMSNFPIPSNIAIELVCVGDSGRRAVWLERNWETDRFTLMKATFSAINQSCAESLLHPHLVLPFEPSACQSLAFHESSGRVGCGFYNGEFYILNF